MRAVLNDPRFNAYRIVAVGGEEVVDEERLPRVEYLGHLSDLAELYAGASCLLFPSLHEGFGLPIIEMISGREKVVQVLVLTPTRELCLQVAEELISLGNLTKLKILPVYGGQSMELQLKHLKKGVHIVTGTPGRIIDHLRRGSLDLSALKFCVLDEADEMLNMGFLEDVEKILSYTNPQKRTLLFSATMPPGIMKIVKQQMNAYQVISVKKIRDSCL